MQVNVERKRNTWLLVSYANLDVVSSRQVTASWQGCSRWGATRSFFFFNDTATTETYSLPLHDALPIWPVLARNDPLNIFGRQRQQTLLIAAAECRKKILHNLDILFDAHRNLSISLTSDRVRSNRTFWNPSTRAKSHGRRSITAAS